MSMPFLGEIRIFAGNFAPYGWVFCDGRLMSIAEYDALYSLIGTIYGGDGINTFGLPDLRGRVPIHVGYNNTNGQTYIIGEMSGAEQVTLTNQQLPSHYHNVLANSNNGTLNGPTLFPTAANYPAKDPTGSNIYSDTNNNSMVSTGITGGSQPHNNLSPFTCLSFIIAVEGLYPSRS